MPGFETVDDMEIDAPAQVLFDTILDYTHMHEWYPKYRVEVVGGGEVEEGATLQHTLTPAPLVKSKFTRVIDSIDSPRRIDERYTGGDLVGRGRWMFVPIDENRTKVSFWCDVRSNSLMMHLGFLFGGEKGHNGVYHESLSARKEKVAAA